MSHSKLGFTEAVMDKLSLEAEEAKRRQLAQLAEGKNCLRRCWRICRMHWTARTPRQPG